MRVNGRDFGGALLDSLRKFVEDLTGAGEIPALVIHLIRTRATPFAWLRASGKRVESLSARRTLGVGIQNARVRQVVTIVLVVSDPSIIEATCLKQGIVPQQLTIHADRGAPMRSKLVSLLFSDLGIEASHSRPRVSNDNPFSEAQFRTFKYRPEFPDRFGSLEHARSLSHDLFDWYNDAHHHSGLIYLTPADVHDGRADEVLAGRHQVRLAAYAAHPERFVNGPPSLQCLPREVWINPPMNTTGQDAPQTTIVTPDDLRHGVITGPQVILAHQSTALIRTIESLQ